MSGEAPATDATPAAVDAAATDLLETPAADAAAPVTDDTKGDKPVTESKPDAKASGDDVVKADAEDLLADDDEGTPDKKADGQADADAEKAPETYEAFTLPEGVQLDEAVLAQATPVFKDVGLNQEQAQKLVSFYASMQAEAAAEQVAGFNKIKSEWAGELKADREFGGENLSKTVGATKALIGKFGSARLLSDLKEWGWGNHPEFQRMCARINATLSPDTTVIADAAHQTAPKSAAEVMWPGMFNNKE